MGRSSNSSHYQISTNKLVSRVHVRAVYMIASPPDACKIEVQCLGWNGARVHCQGKAWLLHKGDRFTSENVDVDVMVDVQDARVLVRWPRHENKITTPVDSDSPWEDENSPRPVHLGSRRSPYQSPLRYNRLQSPISPTPAMRAPFTSSTFLPSDPPIPPPIQVYEDERSEDEAEQPSAKIEETQSTQKDSQPLAPDTLSKSNEFSDADEENDPVVHSFGPFGADILPRMESFTTESPEQQLVKPRSRRSVSSKIQVSSESTDEEITESLINHVINQLAFARVSSTPLSTLMDHLPSLLKAKDPSSKGDQPLSVESLKKLLDATKCIGKVEREGKDAAGKQLESEYYYMADLDLDVARKDAVIKGLRKPGLRSCRKQHKVCFFNILYHSSFSESLLSTLKQYFWRKPK